MTCESSDSTDKTQNTSVTCTDKEGFQYLGEPRTGQIKVDSFENVQDLCDHLWDLDTINKGFAKETPSLFLGPQGLSKSQAFPYEGPLSKPDPDELMIQMTPDEVLAELKEELKIASPERAEYLTRLQEAIEYERQRDVYQRQIRCDFLNVRGAAAATSAMNE